MEIRRFYFFSFPIILTGDPKAFELLGISLFTKEPAPMITFSPTFTFGSMVVPAPTKVDFPIETPPHMVTPGAICTKSLILQSWSIEEFVFIIQCFPIFLGVVPIFPK